MAINKQKTIEAIQQELAATQWTLRVNRDESSLTDARICLWADCPNGAGLELGELSGDLLGDATLPLTSVLQEGAVYDTLDELLGKLPFSVNCENAYAESDLARAYDPDDVTSSVLTLTLKAGDDHEGYHEEDRLACILSPEACDRIRAAAALAGEPTLQPVQ